MSLLTTSNLVATAGLMLSILLKILRHTAGPLLIALSMLATSQVHAGSIDMATRVDLQLGLKNYIESRTSDNGYEYFNIETGKIEKLALKNLHPIIFVNGSKYMMCADFQDASGNDVLLDYIVSLSGGEFRVEQEIPGRRNYLKQLFERIY